MTPPIYTHTFEFECESALLEGELAFDGANFTSIKFNAGYEITDVRLRQLTAFFDTITAVNLVCGDIASIEINKKVP